MYLKFKNDPIRNGEDTQSGGPGSYPTESDLKGMRESGRKEWRSRLEETGVKPPRPFGVFGTDGTPELESPSLE